MCDPGEMCVYEWNIEVGKVAETPCPTGTSGYLYATGIRRGALRLFLSGFLLSSLRIDAKKTHLTSPFFEVRKQSFGRKTSRAADVSASRT
jgi:hypothetical protein